MIRHLALLIHTTHSLCPPGYTDAGLAGSPFSSIQGVTSATHQCLIVATDQSGAPISMTMNNCASVACPGMHDPQTGKRLQLASIHHQQALTAAYAALDTGGVAIAFVGLSWLESGATTL